jgi:8-oxo-dGTP diphosphatase
MARYCWRCASVLPAPLPTTCAACGQPHYLNPRPCGEAVVISGGDVLLLRRAADPYRGYWDVPGGFCDAAEHPMHAAERELAEELGLAGTATAYVGTWIDTYGAEFDRTPIHTSISVYLVALADPGAEPRLQPEEAVEARWFPLDALPDGVAFPGHTLPMLEVVRAVVSGTAPALPDRAW